MVGSLNRKLSRDLARLKGQVVTIALVVACGISSYITMRSAYDSLLSSRDEYYRDFRFGDVFASLKRAPRSLHHRFELIDGVSRVETRVVEQVLVPMPNMARPASGTVVSRDPRQGGSRLNQVYLKSGRDLDPTRHDEVLVLEGFAKAHHMTPGDTMDAVVNGTLRTLRVVGIALSPEYVLALAPGQLTYDPALTPVLWMNESALEAAFQMEGAFNNVSLSLEPGVNVPRIVADVDTLLEPFGGFGAVPREKQSSHFMLSGELTQLQSMASFVPYLFLGVAALLVNVVLSRLVQLQRSQIATLKAVGYADRSIGLHYLTLVSVIVLLGAALGVLVGAWMGQEMTEMYTSQWFRFPSPRYRLEFGAILFSVGVSVGAALLGAWMSVRSVMALPPAEAMRPPAPARYRRSVLEYLGIWKWLDPQTRMMWRELSRRPLRLLLSAVGISLAVGILVVGRSMWDAMDHLMHVQLHRSMREDLSVTFAQPLSPRAARQLESLPGVFRAEGLRAVPTRFRAGHRSRDAVIWGYPDDVELRKILTASGSVYGKLPERGIVLTRKLGEILHVEVGDEVQVELREGEWNTHLVPIAAFVDEPFGLQGHMRLSTLSRLLGDQGAISTVLLSVDPPSIESVERRLKGYPGVASVSSPHDFKRQFDEQSAAMIGVFTFIMTVFASVIAIGVVYNNARVALSQRNRELASLRVLGYTRREISSILFGEQAVQVLLAIPLGLVFGRWMSEAMMAQTDPETYRFSINISDATYLYAVAITLGSAFVSALIVRRKIQTLDLIGVLKTRE